MALTWREVTAPQMDTRGLAQAGQSIVGSFDRLGQMFVDREIQKRVEATKAAKVGYLSETDPTKLAAMIAEMAKQPGGPNQRVDMSEVLQGAHDQRRQLIQAADANEDMLNKQAAGKYGKDGMALMRAALAGDENARAEIDMRNAADPLWARYAGTIAKDVTSFDDDRIDNVEGERNNRAQNAASATSAAAAMMNARSNAAESSFRIAQLRKQEAEQQRAEQTLGFAGRVADWYVKKGWTAEDAIVEAQKGKAYQALTTDGERQAYLKRLGDTINARQGLTSVDRDDGTPFSIKRFDDLVTPAKNRIGRMAEDLTRNFTHAQPGLDIATRAAQLKTKPTENSLAATFEKMKNKPPFMNFMMNGVRDGSIDPRVAQVVLEDFSTGLLDGGGIRAQSLMKTGTQLFLDQGNPGSAIDRLNQTLAPLQARQALLDELLGKARRDKAANRQVDAKTWRQLSTLLETESDDAEAVNRAIEQATRRPRNKGTPIKVTPVR